VAGPGVLDVLLGGLLNVGDLDLVGSGDVMELGLELSKIRKSGTRGRQAKPVAKVVAALVDDKL
jgi:hypothetical protein